MTKAGKAILGALGAVGAFFGIRYLMRAAPPGTGIITGTVYDAETEEPLAGVQCQLNGIASATSKADGTFKLANIPEGSYVLSLKKEFYEEGNMSVEVIASETTDVGIMGMTPVPTTGALTGTVVDADTGAAIMGATVAVSGPESREATTDSNGVFLFPDLSPGTYSGEVSAAGYETGYF